MGFPEVMGGYTFVRWVFGIHRDKRVIVVFLKGEHPLKTPHLPFLHGNPQYTC
jgi:hypothetical protein